MHIRLIPDDWRCGRLPFRLARVVRLGMLLPLVRCQMRRCTARMARSARTERIGRVERARLPTGRTTIRGKLLHVRNGCVV